MNFDLSKPGFFEDLQTKTAHLQQHNTFMNVPLNSFVSTSIPGGNGIPNSMNDNILTRVDFGSPSSMENTVNAEIAAAQKAAAALQGGDLSRAGQVLEGTAINQALKGMTGVDVASTAQTIGGIADIVGELLNQGGGGGGTILVGGINDQGVSSVGRINREVDSIETTLKTDVKNIGFGQFYETEIKSGNDIGFVALHMVNGYLQLPTTSPVVDFFSNIVSFAFVNAVQRAVNFNVSVALISGTNLISYFNTVALALQVSLFWDGIISYTNNPLNRNEAMTAFRNKMSADDINNLNNLNFMLAGLPIPPGLKTICYWFMQTYKLSSLSGSPVIKVCPVEMVKNGSFTGFMPSTTTGTTSLSALITSLIALQGTTAIIAAACPKWITGKIPSVNSKPLHDAGFSTFFINSPTVVGSSYRPATSNVDDVYYVTFDNKLDGFILGLASFWDGSAWTPGLFRTFNNTFNTVFYNKFSYEPSLSGCTPTMLNVAIMVNSGAVQCWNANATVPYSFQGANSMGEPVLGVNKNSIVQAVYESVYWLMSIGTIGTKQDRLEYGGRGGGSNKSRRHRSDKDKSEDKKDKK